MRIKFAQLLIAFTLVLAVGGHWAVLQSVAWLGMMVSYSQNDPLVVALEKTFDGQHPCTLCKAVAAGKQDEKKQAVKKADTKLDLFRFAQDTFFDSPPHFTVSIRMDLLQSRVETPPTPPPRLA